MPSVILGLNFAFGEPSACVLLDGAVVSAVEERRVRAPGRAPSTFPRTAIGRCLDEASVSDRDLTDVAVSIRPGLHEADRLRHAARLGATRGAYLEHAVAAPHRRLIEFWEWFDATFAHAPTPPAVRFVERHLAHLGGYYASGYGSAALLSVDGRSEWATTWLGRADGLALECLGQSSFPHSLGLFYAACTEFCGFEPYRDETRTMELAPLGDPERFGEPARELIDVGPGGGLRLDLRSFAPEASSAGLLAPRFERLFGAPRRPGEPASQRHRDVAAAFQGVLEDCLLGLCAHLHETTGERRLVLGGSLALNSAANGRILRESAFEELHLAPNPGDAGTCVGAARHAYHAVHGHGARSAPDAPYLGTAYGDDDIEAVLTEARLPCVRAADACAEAAERLAAGQIVGWFQGAAEFGPRALGNRSVLADPRNVETARRVNVEIRRREAHAPIAPAVPAERAGEWFDVGPGSPHTLRACPVREDRAELLPAALDADRLAPVQTVERRANPRFHELLERFGDATGVPVLLNADFGEAHGPGVESPADALGRFFTSGVDVLFLGDFVVEKRSRAGQSRAGARAVRPGRRPRATDAERGGPRRTGALE